MRNLRQSTAKMLLLLVVVLCASTMKAQSTVYVFVRSTNNFGSGGKVELTLNGTETFDLRGPLKKTMGNVANPSLPLHIYEATKKKFILTEEGKALFAVDYEFVNVSGKSSHLTAEIQLNVSEGSVHYLKIEPKGLNDLQFKVLKEKEGLKLLNDKKHIALSDYNQQ